MSVKQWAEEDRPSTKLLNLGANTLTNAELISILVGSGTAQHNAVEIAQAILSRYDRDLSSWARLTSANSRGLMEWAPTPSARLWPPSNSESADNSPPWDFAPTSLPLIAYSSICAPSCKT